MKFMRTLLILVFAGLDLAQIPDTQMTDGAFNCRYWNAHKDSPEFRLGFVSGYADAWIFVQKTLHSDISLASLTFREVGEGITTFCARPENSRLELLEALMLFAQKAAGVDESILESKAADYRKTHSPPDSGSRDSVQRDRKQ